MGKSIIPAGKKRYLLTLTEENMDKFSYFVTRVSGMPRNQVSIAVDDMIATVVSQVLPLIERYDATGQKPSTADAMILFGKAMQEIGSDELKLPFDK